MLQDIYAIANRLTQTLQTFFFLHVKCMWFDFEGQKHYIRCFIQIKKRKMKKSPADEENYEIISHLDYLSKII